MKDTKAIQNKGIKNNFFLDAGFSIYIFTLTAANHTIFSNYAIILLVILTTYMCLRSKKIFMSWYFILELTFIAYSFYQIKSNRVLYVDAAQDNINTLIKCVSINLTLYNFIIIRNDFNKILSLYVSSIFCGVIALFIFGWSSLLVGRFLHDESYTILGQTADASSNGTGIVAAVAFIICLYLYWKSNRFKCLFINTTLLLCIFLTGSRKAIGLLAVGTFLVIYYMNPKKKLRNTLLVGALVVVGYFLIMNISVFYELLGSRIENTINYISTGNTNESSMKTRINLINLGMKYIKENLIYGYGLANYSQIVTNGGYYSHNNFIEILFSGGIIGFCIYYFKYLFVLMNVFTTKIKKGVNTYLIMKILLSLFITFAILEYWFVTYYERNYMIIHIFILALCKLYKNGYEIKNT